MKLKIQRNMNTGNKIFLWIGFPATFLIGILAGKTIEYSHYIKWDNHIGLVSGLSLIVTTAIGVMIPFVIKKLIDDNRGIKFFVVEEVKDLIKIVSSIKDIISNAHQKSKFEALDKDKIIFLFHLAELKIGSIADQLEISFKKQSPKIIQKLKDALSEYKRYLTDNSGMMISTFNQVDDHFYQENSNEYSKVETSFKTTIHLIHKF